MKIVRFSHRNQEAYGLLEGETIYALEGSLFGQKQRGQAVTSLSEVRLLAPLTPGKVVGVGLNYRDHAAESGKPLPTAPLMFMKPSTGVIGPEEAIIYPPQSQLVHYEAELAVIIGRRAKNVSEAEALDFVLGYTCANDVSARDIQYAEGHNTHGKAFDTFLPLGPAIVTGLDHRNLRIASRVNGEGRQNSSTANLVFGVAYLVSHISQVMTLLPGDVIITGTPAGVGPLAVGDVVEVEIEDIGVLRNTVK